jgi:hypothetical protein
MLGIKQGQISNDPAGMERNLAFNASAVVHIEVLASYSEQDKKKKEKTAK